MKKKAAIFWLALMLAGAVSCRKEEGFVIIAHRGASFVTPENTLAAYTKAMELGADYAELDVHLTKDGELVLMHDDTLKRTTGQEGEVWNFSLQELKKLDAGSWFGEKFKGEPIPTLREVIRRVRGRMKLNIEIKISREEPDIVNKVIDIIYAENFEKKCIVTSFDRQTVEAVKALDPAIKTGFLFYEKYPEDVFEGSWDVLCSHFELVDEMFLSRARKFNKKVYVWTVNEEPEMRRLLNLGVNGIITDRPDLLKQVLSGSGTVLLSNQVFRLKRERVPRDFSL